jgi:hypothetical protein
MSATLPNDVTWDDETQTEIGTLTYNSTTRQVTWNIPKYLTEIGQTQGWFEVSVTPTSDDVGQFMKLINTTSFTGTDIVTKESLSASMTELTTELIGDSTAEGDGIVIE